MVPAGAFLSPLTGRRLSDSHEQKDGGLASDEGVTEISFPSNTDVRKQYKHIVPLKH